MGRSQRPNLGATSARAEARRAKRSAEPAPPALATAASRPSNGERGNGRRGSDVRAVVAADVRAAPALGVAAPSSVATSSATGADEVRVCFELADDGSGAVDVEAVRGGAVGADVLGVPTGCGVRPAGVVADGAPAPVAMFVADVAVETTCVVAVASVAVAVLATVGATAVVLLTTACAACTV
jgi:hypothetical protein